MLRLSIFSYQKMEKKQRTTTRSPKKNTNKTNKNPIQVKAQLLHRKSVQ